MILIFIVSGTFLFFIIYLFNLQVLNGTKYQNRARNVSIRMLPIPAQRGEIYDKNMDQPLVINVDSFAVNIIPGELDKITLKQTLGKLSNLFKIPAGDLEKKITTSYRHLFQPVELISNVNLHDITFIAEHKEDFPGVTWNSKPIRNYISNESLTHILGYVGDITVEEYQVLYNKDMQLIHKLGKAG